MTSTEFCPHCAVSLRGHAVLSHKGHTGVVYPKDAMDAQGDPITESNVHVYRDGKPVYGSSTIGVEIWGLYDGVLFWQCPDCNGRWHRWPPGDRLWHRAEPYVSGDKALR